MSDECLHLRRHRGDVRGLAGGTARRTTGRLAARRGRRPAGGGVRGACALRGRARDRTAGPRHRPRGRRALARLPHGCRGARADTRGLTATRAGR